MNEVTPMTTVLRTYPLVKSVLIVAVAASPACSATGAAGISRSRPCRRATSSASVRRPCATSHDADSGSWRSIRGTRTSAGSAPITNIQRQPRFGITAMASAAVVTAPTW
jgi:hypothetical protein